jgi:hypothetical protein
MTPTVSLEPEPKRAFADFTPEIYALFWPVRGDLG